MDRRTLIDVSISGVIASLAVVMTLAKLVFPYPLLPYLKFELAEIPVVLAALSLSGRASLYTAVIYWIVLLFVGEWTPIGPTMKFLAVLTTIGGIVIASRIRSVEGRTWILLAFLISTLLRTAVMTLANYVIIVFVMPGFLAYATQLLKSVGIVIKGGELALVIVLLLTALYNVIHVAMDLAVALPIVRSLKNTRIYSIITQG